MRPKLYRDPVHDIIAFNLEDEVEAAVFGLLGTHTVQRLRRIRQLGFANLVYHGAEHSRYAHTLGVVHVARRILAALDWASPQDRLDVLCAAVLHDVGHGPFSHAIERVTGVHHEAYTLQIIEGPDSEIFRHLSAIDPALPERVAAYFRGRDAFGRDRQVLLDIVSSQLDADRLDYILRDGLATGVKIGVYDFERIATMFEVYEAPDGSSRRLAVSYRAREAVEGYLIARFHMFKQVYLHKAVRSAEKMLESVLRRAGQLIHDDYKFAEALDPRLMLLLTGERLSSDAFVALDDTDIWVALKHWRDDPDPVLSMLSSGLLDRTLFKTIILDPNDPVLIARTVDQARQIAKAKGYDPEYCVLLDRASDTPYTPYDPLAERSAAHIPIIEKNGSVTPIEDISDFVHLLGRDQYKITFLCVPPEVRTELDRYLEVTKS